VHSSTLQTKECKVDEFDKMEMHCLNETKSTSSSIVGSGGTCGGATTTITTIHTIFMTTTTMDTTNTIIAAAECTTEAHQPPFFFGDRKRGDNASLMHNKARFCKIYIDLMDWNVE
jgi:hypothetical protein